MRRWAASIAIALVTFGAAAPAHDDEKRSLSELAWSQWKAKHFEESLATFNHLLTLARATGDRKLEASTINFIGLCYQNLGDFDTASAKYDEAFALARTLDDPKLLGEVLFHIGWLHFVRGRQRESIGWYEQSLAARRAARDVFGEGITLSHLGMAHHAVGEYEKAIDYENAALPLLRQSGDRRAEADALDDTGIALTELGRSREAAQLHRQALQIRREIGDEFGATMSLTSLARAQRANGEIDDAIKQQGEVIDIVESARQSLGDRNLRGSLFASRQGHYTRMIDLLMEARREAEALSMSERARARLTLDALQEALVPGATATPLTAEEIQRSVLDRDTALVEYALGNDRSFVWVMTTTSIAAHTLPKRSEIESAARRLHALLAAREERKRQHDVDLAVANLSKLVLPPLPRNVTRLLIVADGALHFVPFSILGTMRPLVADYEVVNAPSASVIALVRRIEAAREASPKTLAIVADPVFRADDPRVHGKLRGAAAPPPPPDVLRAATESGLATLTRLPYTRIEANTIAKLARGATLEALDFDASRATVTSERFSHFGAVHFATHALVNTKAPERSGIVLSLVDRDGRPVDGFLRAAEIYRLRLDARLVVLSACSTAMGKEVRGEGLVGLVRGFMYAGAPRVVASYWNVRDSATADLMSRFYGESVRGVAPSRALRNAELAMAKERGWRSPQAWAAFALFGDWR